MRIRNVQLWLIFAVYESENGANATAGIFSPPPTVDKDFKNSGAI
jgi:hypothetical protein